MDKEDSDQHSPLDPLLPDEDESADKGESADDAESSAEADDAEGASDALDTMPCPSCGEANPVNAEECEHCGASIEVAEELPAFVQAADSAILAAHKRKDAYEGYDPVVALIWSFFIPGAGQLYKGQVRMGLAFFFFAALLHVALWNGALSLEVYGLYFWILLYAFLQAGCCVHAYSNDD